MYGDLGNKLILDAKRSTSLSEVPIFQGDLIRSIVREISDLNADAEYLQLIAKNEQDESEEEQKIKQCQLFVTHLSMRRNKRCLLGYERLRAEKIDEFCWLNLEPTVLNSSKDTKAASSASAAYDKSLTGYLTNYTTLLTLDNLNHAEQEYYRGYQDIITNYKSMFADIDLSGDLNPPTDIFIDVRVLKNGGEVQTEYGTFNLIKDSQFFVRKSDVERLIQQGYLEEI